MSAPRLVLLAAWLALVGCYTQPSPQISGLSSFVVSVTGVTLAGSTTPAPVVTTCENQYGGEAKVPADVRGTPSCRYSVGPAAVDITVNVTALDVHGQQLSVDRPESFRVKPGSLDGDYDQRFVMLSGGVGTGTVRANHVSGDVRVWVEDAPVQVIYADDGGTGGTLSEIPDEPDDRNNATGTTNPIAFQDPTLAMVQTPDDATSETDPFVDQFVNIGDALDGNPPIQSCPDDPTNDGQPLKMVVTGVDAQGYYITDVTACRQKEVAVAHTMPEPDGFYPSTYGHIYVYNSSFPVGITEGDLLQTVAGSITEFTDSTQMSFDSWSLADDVSLLPPDQQTKYLDQVPIYTVTERTCGCDNTLTPFISDALCGYSYSNLKMESLESALVKIVNVRFPSAFVDCDLNGDGTVEFFCPFDNIWQACFDTGGDDPLAAERQCNIDCTVGQDLTTLVPSATPQTICTEESTYATYGQFVVEMTPPGPAAAHMDDSLPARQQSVTLNGSAEQPGSGYGAGAELAIWCTGPAHYKFGSGSVAASNSDALLPAKTILRYTLSGTETTVSLLGSSGTCSVAQNPRVRINALVENALPAFNVNCNEQDPDATAATQCQAIHNSTYDIVGHLTQVAPARPRWEVILRDISDICCRPAPGKSCPTPVAQCPD